MLQQKLTDPAKNPYKSIHDSLEDAIYGSLNKEGTRAFKAIFSVMRETYDDVKRIERSHSEHKTVEKRAEQQRKVQKARDSLSDTEQMLSESGMSMEL